MTFNGRTFLARAVRVIAVVIALALLVAVVVAGRYYWLLRGSLPVLDGEIKLTGLGSPVHVERDALGVPTITGASRVDVARALGFVHAQDRFFQMDLFRRNSAGELADLFGKAAVPLDSANRMHGFRSVAREVVSHLDPEQRALVDAYVAGVNAGLAALKAEPWEYRVLRTTPAPWRDEDTVLVIFAMWMDLQDGRGRFERSLGAVAETLGPEALAFLSPRGGTWDAALDGSTFPEAMLPASHPSAWLEQSRKLQPVPLPDRAGSIRAPLADDPEARPGSNNWAVSGAHTANGAALVANDMHLGLSMPNTWYRAALKWQDPAGPLRVSGMTLPGVPVVVTGSNGHIAWGFTNAYIDTVDLVLVVADPTGAPRYRTSHGWADMTERTETIRVNGAEPVPLVVRSTEWGPLLGEPDADGRVLAVHWSAHDPAATDFAMLAIETAADVEEAMTIAHACGMPNQNMVVGDSGGHVAWTVTGKIPRRRGFDGRVPVSWADGSCGWNGWLPPDEVPVIRNPTDGIIWSANNRIVGGEALARLGDGGYGLGARARQIHDDLRALAGRGRAIAPRDLLQVQLDDRALFLERWQKLLVSILTDAAVAERPQLAAVRHAVRGWSGRADIDSAGYRFVRFWRTEVARRVLEPMLAPAKGRFPDLRFWSLNYEDALWRLVNEKPAGALGATFASWDHVLLEAAESLATTGDPAAASALPTWGARNTLRMRHPLSPFLPTVLARLLDAPAVPLPGDGDMPRVQGPAFGASERMVVSVGHEEESILHLPGGQSAHPLSPFHLAGHDAWVRGEATPFLPGRARYTLVLRP